MDKRKHEDIIMQLDQPLG